MIFDPDFKASDVDRAKLKKAMKKPTREVQKNKKSDNRKIALKK